MKFGICSEIFDVWGDIERAMDFAKSTGYDGFEIAPCSLADHVTDISAEMRRDIVRAAARAELDIIGLHWLLVGPSGIHLTHPDKEVRERTTQYLKDLARFCADVAGKLLVLGSPKQRDVMEGVDYSTAEDYAVEAIEAVLPVCEELGVVLCMEQLSPRETNFCCTVEQTVALIERVDHPLFRLHLDVKAMVDEPAGRPATIRRYAKRLTHFHANDENLCGPGWGDVDFGPIFEALRDVGYDDYISVEVFKFEPGPEAIAVKSLEYLKSFV